MDYYNHQKVAAHLESHGPSKVQLNNLYLSHSEKQNILNYVRNAPKIRQQNTTITLVRNAQ